MNQSGFRKRKEQIREWISHADMEKESFDDNYFREVLFMGPHSQLVVMALNPGDDIGQETHPETDQFISAEDGMIHKTKAEDDAYERQNHK
jgi:hypothetical protein